MDAKMCLAFNEDTGKCNYRSCSLGQRKHNGMCKADGHPEDNRKEKKHQNYLCSMERTI